jgi:hypothetical protein
MPLTKSYLLGFSLINHLDLDSELELDMDEPAFANNAPAPASTFASDLTKHAATTSVLAPQPKALDTTLPYFFPQQSTRAAAAARFTRTESEAQIRLRWEVARGELTHEWKRRHREAVKSRRRRGGGGGRAE